METYSEDEQIEAIKEWWREYGRSIVIGLVLGVSTLGGWQYWDHSQTKTGEEASVVFYQMMEAYDKVDVAEGKAANAADIAAFQKSVETLKTDFVSSEYASYAALQNAKYQVEEGKLEAAAAELQWILDSNPNDGLSLLTSLRLGRVLLALDDLDKALALAQTKNVGSYQAAFDELAGDVYAKQGEIAKAQESYQAAMDGASEDAQNRNNKQTLEMKYHSLLGK